MNKTYIEKLLMRLEKKPIFMLEVRNRRVKMGFPRENGVTDWKTFLAINKSPEIGISSCVV